MPLRQVLLFAEVFSAKVLPHVYGLLRAADEQAVADGKASLTAGLTARPTLYRVYFASVAAWRSILAQVFPMSVGDSAFARAMARPVADYARAQPCTMRPLRATLPAS